MIKLRITVFQGISNVKCDARKHTTKGEISVIIIKILQIEYISNSCNILNPLSFYIR